MGIGSGGARSGPEAASETVLLRLGLFTAYTAAGLYDKEPGDEPSRSGAASADRFGPDRAGLVRAPAPAATSVAGRSASGRQRRSGILPASGRDIAAMASARSEPTDRAPVSRRDYSTG